MASIHDECGNPMKTRRFLQIAFCILSCLASFGANAMRCSGKTKPYTPKNGILNFNTIVFGGAFRVSTAIPLHGDFAKFDRVEISKLQSRIGKGVPPEVLNQLTQTLRKEFERGRRFAEVNVAD